MGMIDFVYPKFNPERIHVFLCKNFDGEKRECLEGELYWIDRSKVSSLNLWPGDHYFLPRIFMKDCPYFHYEMSYDERGSLIKVKELI